MANGSRVNIREVARRAGVSVASVSRVMNGKGPVSEDTRNRVLAVAEELRYAPHGAARSLITSRTDNIAVLLPDIHGEFFSELIRGIDRAARGRGFHLLFSSSHGDRTETQAVLRSIRGRVDGLILMSPDLEVAALLDGLPEPLPVVLLNAPAGLGRCDSLGVDNFGGAEAMVHHLAAQGARRIALVGGPPENHDAQERLRGYRSALAALGLPRDAGLELPGDFSEASGNLAGRALLALAPRPDAVFAANDAMALGCLYALREGGLHVPEQIALAGFDDIPLARFTNPPLTTVRVPIEQLGQLAFERLRTVIEGGEPRQHEDVVLPTQLVVRASCGAPRTASTP